MVLYCFLMIFICNYNFHFSPMISPIISHLLIFTYNLLSITQIPEFLPIVFNFENRCSMWWRALCCRTAVCRTAGCRTITTTTRTNNNITTITRTTTNNTNAYNVQSQWLFNFWMDLNNYFDEFYNYSDAFLIINVY